MSNWIRPPAGRHPLPTDVRAARCAVHAAAAEWGPFDVVRLAALIKLGKPADVVRNGPAVVIKPGDTWGGRMPMLGESPRAAALHAWRMVAQLAGWPLPPAHATKDAVESQDGEEPRTADEVAGAFASLSTEDKAKALKLILHLSKVPK